MAEIGVCPMCDEYVQSGVDFVEICICVSPVRGIQRYYTFHEDNCFTKWLSCVTSVRPGSTIVRHYNASMFIRNVITKSYLLEDILDGQAAKIAQTDDNSKQ